jgi:uncharacterized protein (DUF58 family)
LKETVEDYRKYLDPKVLAKISGLDLRARLVVEGIVSGMHRSPYRGYSVEFAEHREYSQGDDLRHLDWKVFGRTNKHYIKQYEEETNLVCNFVVDCSESMAYRSDPDALSKHEYATAIAASLAYLLLQQQDSVGIGLFDESISRYIKPSNSPAQWKTIVKELDNATGPKKTSIRHVLDDLAERAHRRSLIIIISDMFDDPEDILAGLKHLRYRRNEVIIFNVFDPAELHFPFKGTTLFKGLEGFSDVLADPNALRRRYLDEVEKFITQMRQGCRGLHIDYEIVDTAQSLDAVLSTYLAVRSTRLMS